MTETSIGIEVGRKMPVFELPDEEGKPFNLAEQLQKGPIVLVFYRGDW
ncbi:MAG: redoxin domain-containing protein [Rubrobacter sp.]|nr:redoxin domain-containing protein [Rubrobacter sp.]